jgi:DNA-binding response OmpR family regulator
MKILIVDDDVDLLALVGFALGQAGFTTVKAADARSGVATFAAESPDLAILDINLPDGSGFDVCEAIRKQSRIPIMMLTARARRKTSSRRSTSGPTITSPSHSVRARCWHVCARSCAAPAWKRVAR